MLYILQCIRSHLCKAWCHSQENFTVRWPLQLQMKLAPFPVSGYPLDLQGHSQRSKKGGYQKSVYVASQNYPKSVYIASWHYWKRAYVACTARNFLEKGPKIHNFCAIKNIKKNLRYKECSYVSYHYMFASEVLLVFLPWKWIRNAHWAHII